MGMLEWNKGQACARQASYLLDSFSCPILPFFKPEILVYNTKKSICCIDLIIDIFSTILHIIAIHPSFSFSLLLSNIANLDFFLFDFLVGIRHVVFIFTKTLH